MRADNLVGQKFGMLLVEQKSDTKLHNRYPWVCRCDCGNTRLVDTNNLKKGRLFSCGCTHRRPRKFPDLSGQTFGRLTALSLHSVPAKGPVRWLCRCECGTEKIVDGENLKYGHTTSCGCAKGTHRHTKANGKSPTYVSWQSMMARCYYPSNPAHAYYKSLGIEVCERWHTFSNFLADMGERPDGTTLDRYPDKTGDYEPGNCRWATKKEQANNRVTNRSLEYKGQFYTLAELCEATGLTKDFLHGRLRNGWSVEDAVKTPKMARYFPR